MKLYKNDIKKIGYATFENHLGNLNILCDPLTSNIEEILLRSILSKFGKYKIIRLSDFDWKDGVIDTEITTDLPYELFRGIE